MKYTKNFYTIYLLLVLIIFENSLFAKTLSEKATTTRKTAGSLVATVSILYGQNFNDGFQLYANGEQFLINSFSGGVHIGQSVITEDIFKQMDTQLKEQLQVLSFSESVIPLCKNQVLWINKSLEKHICLDGKTTENTNLISLLKNWKNLSQLK